MRVRNIAAAGAVCLAVLAPGAASAQESGRDYTGDYIDYVGGRSPELDRRLGDPDVEVLGRTVERDSMPVTGGDLVGLALLGAGAVGIGALLTRTRRTAETTD